MASYKRFRNWNASKGTYSNGRGETIRDPRSYFDAVGKNIYGYNTSYKNGRGETIHNPKSYFKAVAEDRYGYNNR